MIEYNVSERRIVNKLGAYWNSLRCEKSYPSLEDINMEEIIEICPYCFIVELIALEENIYKFNCTYMGEKAMEVYNNDLTLNSESETLLIEADEYLSEYLNEVTVRKEPVIFEQEIQDRNGNDVKIRQCLFPLGDNEKITCIIGAVSYKIYY